MTFSIVMPSFNQKPFIYEAISSVINQEGDFYIDLIIKDGGSKDGALEIIKGFEQDFKTRFKQKKVGDLNYFIDDGSRTIKCLGISYRWSSHKDDGFADAINEGISESKGDFFSYLNTDDYLSEGCLQKVFKAFQTNLDVDVVYGEGWDVDINGKVINRYGTKDINKWRLADGNCIPQPSTFIRKSFVDKTDGFSRTIKNSIDYEYWLRLQSMGAKFLYINEYLSSTRIHGNSKTLRNRSLIIKETLAIMLHYGGDLKKIDSEFMWGMSWFGRYSSLLPRPLNKVRRVSLKLFTRVWLQFNYQKIASYRKKIFASINIEK